MDDSLARKSDGNSKVKTPEQSFYFEKRKYRYK